VSLRLFYLISLQLVNLLVVAQPLVGIQGRRTPGAAPRSRRAAQSQPEASPGLGGSNHVRRAGPEVAADAAGASLGHSRHGAALASSPCHQEMDISPPRRTSTHRGHCGLVDRTHSQGKSELGIPANPGRAAHTQSPRGSVDDPPRSPAVADPSSAGQVHRHDLAAVPARAGIHDAGMRLLPRRLPR
jgi:hypothetical protein